MFKIGEFSRFTRVSVKTLRHYDEVGLLRPRVVDRFTNYRYYSADQVPRLNQILALRELGFSLGQIARLLDAGLSPEQLQGMFLGKRAEIVARLAEEEAQLGRVDAFLAQLADPQAARYDVVVRQVEPILVASVREWVATEQVAIEQVAIEQVAIEQDQPGQEQEAEGDRIAKIFEEIEQYVARFGARAGLPPLIVYHDSEYVANGQDLEVAVPLTAAIAATDQIQVGELSGCETMACLIHRGGYEDLSLTFATLLQWIEMNHYRIAGPTRESFLRFGAEQVGYLLPESYVTAQVDELVTELQVPVAKL